MSSFAQQRLFHDNYPMISYSLTTAQLYCPVTIACWQLPSHNCLLTIAQSQLLVDNCPVTIACWQLPSHNCLLTIAQSQLLVDNCPVTIACWQMPSHNCLLTVTRHSCSLPCRNFRRSFFPVTDSWLTVHPTTFDSWIQIAGWQFTQLPLIAEYFSMLF